MTGRERILAAFGGEEPDFIPFTPNIWQWFYYHQTHHSLAPEIGDARHPLDALRYLGADILARWDTQHSTHEVYTGGEFSEKYDGAGEWDKTKVGTFNLYPAHKSRCRRKYVCPEGTLTQTWEYRPEAVSSLGYLLEAPITFLEVPELFCLDLYKDFDLDRFMALAAPTPVTTEKVLELPKK